MVPVHCPKSLALLSGAVRAMFIGGRDIHRPEKHRLLLGLSLGCRAQPSGAPHPYFYDWAPGKFQKVLRQVGVQQNAAIALEGGRGALRAGRQP